MAEQKKNRGTITITIPLACAEELFIAMIRAAGPGVGLNPRGGGAGSDVEVAGFGLAGEDDINLAGHDDTYGHD
jgi:hypothetical protein